MSRQLTLGEGFYKYARTTKRAQFLREMDRIIPGSDLCDLIAPVYPVARRMPAVVTAISPSPNSGSAGGSGTGLVPS